MIAGDISDDRTLLECADADANGVECGGGVCARLCGWCGWARHSCKSGHHSVLELPELELCRIHENSSGCSGPGVKTIDILTTSIGIGDQSFHQDPFNKIWIKKVPPQIPKIVQTDFIVYKGSWFWLFTHFGAIKRLMLMLMLWPLAVKPGVTHWKRTCYSLWRAQLVYMATGDMEECWHWRRSKSRALHWGIVTLYWEHSQKLHRAGGNTDQLVTEQSTHTWCWAK